MKLTDRSVRFVKAAIQHDVHGGPISIAFLHVNSQVSSLNLGLEEISDYVDAIGVRFELLKRNNKMILGATQHHHHYHYHYHHHYNYYHHHDYYHHHYYHHLQ